MSKNKTTPIQQTASSAPVEEKVLDQTTPAVEDKQEEQPQVEEQPSPPQVEETPAVVVPEVQEVAQQPSSPFEEGALVATPKKIPALRYGHQRCPEVRQGNGCSCTSVLRHRRRAAEEPV